jgi:5-hydroxyisourate hydrolase
MKGIYCLLLASVLSFSVSAAEKTNMENMRNPVSVHILDQGNGKPATDVVVTLERKEGIGWLPLSSSVTDSDGRVNALYPKASPLSAGVYRITFKTGDYFKQHNQPTFFPEIPIVVELSAVDQHYHIPLLVSPFGYSSYRGS